MSVEIAELDEIEQLSNAATELGNHVAAAVRLSNTLAKILADGDLADIDCATRRVIMHWALVENERFRADHFQGLLSSLNAVVGIADRLWQAEPGPPPASDEPDAGETPDETKAKAEHDDPSPSA
jgi:hypothetical protein